MTAARYVVIGVGNAYRGDDGAGLAVVARIRALAPPGTELVACEEEPSRLIEAWHGADGALIVDAIQSGAAPGTVQRFDAGDRPVPAQALRSSTHAFGIGEAIELSRALGTLPPHVLVYGIEGAVFDAVQGLTQAVEEAVEHAALDVLADLRRLTREEGRCTSTP